jgi:peptidoglycan hydrolase CwlO-like protein
MTEEMRYLREELTKSQEESKNLIKELQQMRNQTSHDVEKVRLQALELDKRNAKIKMMQKEFDDLKEQTVDENEQLSKEISKVKISSFS